MIFIPIFRLGASTGCGFSKQELAERDRAWDDVIWPRAARLAANVQANNALIARLKAA